MSDDKSKDPPDTYHADYLAQLPEPPPFRPDPSLIGDMQRPEKRDLTRKRRWFGLRSRAPA
jgi:hypothetical protein